MDSLKTTLITAFVLAILFTPTASAQAVAANIAVVSGNGQMICPTCSFKKFTFFYPMVVKVTDANGNPIANKTVNWQLVSSIGTLPAFDATSVTDGNGLAAARLFQGVQGGSAQLPFLQSVINASVDGVSINFTETQALADAVFNQQIVFNTLDTPIGTVLSGFAGSAGNTPIQVSVTAYAIAVPNVSVRLLSDDPKTLPSASCATGPGADPGSVLTDANGKATCYPVFGPVTGKGPVSVLVGGLDPLELPTDFVSPQPLTDPIAYDEYFHAIQLDVTPVTPGRVSIVSGNNQSIDPGKFSDPLVVKVTDASGAVPIGNTKVDWIVTPAGAATPSPLQSTTDSQGRAQTTVAFSASAAGQVTVRAALTGSNNGISTNFTLSTRVLIATFTKVSGDLQTAQAGQNFGAPLVVQVIGTNGQPLSSQPISYVVSNGVATLSALSAITDGNGRAQISVTAGATPGTVTVTAIIANISQAFTLTIIPPGPALSTNSFYNAGGSTRLGALSPCSLVTVLTTGLAPNVQGLVLNTNAFGPWATTLASVTVTVNNVAAPISSVGNINGVEQLTFQVPCETAPASSVPITINVGGGTATVNFPVQAATPGIFETLMSDSVRRAVVIRPDGTFVSLQNPARRGEVVRVFVTGMGSTIPVVATGALPVPGSDALIDLNKVIVGVNNGGTRVVSVRLSPSLIGVSEVAFQVPSDSPTGNDIVLSVAINAANDSVTRFSNGSKLPVQ